MRWRLYFVWLVLKHYALFWILWLPYVLWETLKENPLLVPVIAFFHVLYSPLMVISSASKECREAREESEVSAKPSRARRSGS